MKPETAILFTKALCYIVIGALTPLSSALAQWANTGEWPPRIIWVVVVSGCIVGGATQLLAFLSGSYSDYLKNRTNGNSPDQVLPKSDTMDSKK